MPGLLRGVARTAAVVGTATAVSHRVSRRPRRPKRGTDRIAASKDPAEPKGQDVLTEAEAEAEDEAEFETGKAGIPAS